MKSKQILLKMIKYTNNIIGYVMDTNYEEF